MAAAGDGDGAVKAEEAKGEGLKKRRAEGLEMLGLCIREIAVIPILLRYDPDSAELQFVK